MKECALSAFFAEPEIPFIRAKKFRRIFALRGKRSGRRPRARSGRKERLDLPLPVQLGAPANPAQGDMRMVLVAPFAIKRCRLKKPVLEGERKLIPNQPSFCAKTESFLYAQKSFPHSRSLRRKNPEGRSAPRTGGSIGPILLRPFSVAALRIPQRTTCGWFWWHLLPPKGASGLRCRFQEAKGAASQNFELAKSGAKTALRAKKTEMMNCGSETPIPEPGYASMTPEPTSSSPSYHAANCPGVMPRWGSSKSR